MLNILVVLMKVKERDEKIMLQCSDGVKYVDVLLICLDRLELLMYGL